MYKFLIVLLPFFWFSTISAQSGLGKPIDVGNNSEFEGFEAVDSLVMGHRLIIVGEDYSYAAFNAKLEFKMLKYLNHKFGLHQYILETSPAKADLVNQYISSGDSTVEKLLQSVSSVKYMRMYKNLKKLNTKLADSLKIMVYGVDVERTSVLPLVRMAQALPEDDTDGNMPDNLRLHVESIKGAAKYIISKGLKDFERERDGQESEYEDYFYMPTAFSVRESVTEFMKSYDTLRDDFKVWLGSKFVDFDQAVDWLKEFKEYNNLRMTAFEYSWREDLMYHRLNSIVGTGHDNEQFYLQLGLCRAGYSQVSTGCGIDRFNGVVYRLKNLPDSKVSDLVSIGIFYGQELEKQDEDFIDAQHRLYKTDLELLFEGVDEKKAVFADFSKISNLTLIQKDFSGVLLNNGYPMTDDDDYDSTYSGLFDYTDTESSYADMGSVFMGYFSVHPMVKLSGLNSQLMAAGLQSIGNLRFDGGDVAFVSSDGGNMGRFFYGASVNSSPNYSAYCFGLESGGPLLVRKFVKWTVSSSFTYFKHKLTDFSTSTSATYFTEYQAPKVFKNPALVMGVGSSLYLDFSPFYVFGSAGYNYDLGSSNWLLDGKKTGSLGSLSNRGFYWTYGFGLSIPFRWVD